MTTHELAKALSKLVSAFRSLPSMELDAFFETSTSGSKKRQDSKDKDAEFKLNVLTLVGLSRIGKDDWKNLIQDWELPIEVPRKDSARNIMGEVMRYLSSNPSVVQRLQHGISKDAKASPALMKALSILLSSDRNSEEPSTRD